MDHLIIFDTETTGVGPDAGVVEAAFVEVDDDLTVLCQHRSLINPGHPIPPGASGVHGIVDADVADAPRFADWMAQVAPQFKRREILVIAHNASFDEKFIRPHCGKTSQFCTLKLARKVWPEAPDHKLATLMYYLGIRRSASHNALDDVMTTHGLLKKACEKVGTDLEGLYGLLQKPVEITVCPLGKHKGLPMSEVPKAYLRWMKEKITDMDADLLRAVNKQLGIK